MSYEINEAYIAEKWADPTLRTEFVKVFCRKTGRKAEYYDPPEKPPVEFVRFLAGNYP